MRGASILWALPIFLVTSSALADVPNDPCQGLSVGDPCTTLDGSDGICLDANGFLTCEDASATTSGTTTSGTTTSGAGGSTSSGGSDGGSTSDGGGDGDDDGGCSIGTLGSRGQTGAGGLFALIGLGLMLRRRR